MTPLLARLETVTTTFPVVAPLGTGTTILVSLQLVGVANVPLNVTVLDPCVAPKPTPVIVTGVPGKPLAGDRLAIPKVTVKLTPLLATPLAVTTTFPVVAPTGTETKILVALQFVATAAAPLKLTVPVPCVAPKFVPVIVTAAPTAPVVTDRLVMLGTGTTVKLDPLLFTPLANTTTFPVVAPLGTVVAILVALQLVTVAAVPLNFTVPLPCVAPKFVPVIVTAAPTAPVVIDRLVMLGAETTVKLDPLLFTPLANTTTLPVVAPEGTVVAILVALQLVTVAAVPLKLTALAPCVAPKFVPVIVTAAPTAPVVTDRLVMLGAGTTVKLDPLLFTPLANTTTFPVVAPEGTVVAMLVALQLVTVAVVPLKLTVPDPCVAPKFVPVIVTAAPTAPVVIDRLVMLGATVKLDPLLFTPLANTTTFPVVAPEGTVVARLVALQLVTVAAVPLKLTVLDPCVEPKFVPVIVTAAPTAPVVTDRLVMFGAGTTVKLDPLLFTPLANTTTFPVVAPLGTVVARLVALQVVTVAAVPLKLTVLDPCVEPKFVPVIVTAVPTAPVVTDRLVMLGAGTTVKLDPLLFTPLANTTTFPVVAPLGTVVARLVALQLVTVAAVPLKLTVFDPCVAPKLVPAIVTAAPTAPVVIDRLVMLGAGTTVKLDPLLFTPLANTTTFPVVAPLGTVVARLVALQLVTVAVVPLKLTVLDPCVEPKFVPVIVTAAPTAPVVTDRLVMLGAGTTVKLDPL